MVCLITGPAGAGKSSVANALAEKFKRSVVVNVDFLRHMIIGGKVRPWPWNDEVKSQTSLGAENACILAINFLKSGFNVIIDDVIGAKLFRQYSEFFSDRSFKIFLLLPTLESLLGRFDRRGTDDKLRKRTIELHEKFSQCKDELNWQVIDSSNQTLDVTVSQIFDVLTK